jgi:serine/threonine-protein kinase
MDAGTKLVAVADDPLDAALPPPDAAPPPPDAAPPPPDAAPRVDRRPAYLTVDSSPYATIYVDGKKLGVTPLFKVKLKPGKHRLKAVSATGQKQTRRLVLRPGRTKNLGRLRW